MFGDSTASKFTPRVQSVCRGTIQGKTCQCPNWWTFGLILRRNTVILNQWTTRDNWSFKRFSKASFIWWLPIRQEILNVPHIGVAFHGNLPTMTHPDLIATIQQRYLLSLCALLSQQSHLFLICMVLTYNDSRKDVHRLSQLQGIVSVIDFEASYRAPRTCASILVSWEVLVLLG